MPNASSAPSALPWVNVLPARMHHPVFGLFLLAIAVEVVRRWLGLAWPNSGPDWSAALWVLAAATLALGLARRLPEQNVAAVAFVAAAIGSLADLLNSHTSIPFGQRDLTTRAGPELWGVAWFQPFLWVALAISGRGVARLILRPWRKLRYYGFWVMGAATALTLATATAFEPFAADSHWWWRESRTALWSWYGAPPAAALGWALTTLLIYGFTTPWFLNKQPVKQPTDWHPLLVWESLMIWLAVGNAQNGAWWAVGAGVFVGAAAAIFAIRGGRW